MNADRKHCDGGASKWQDQGELSRCHLSATYSGGQPPEGKPPRRRPAANLAKIAGAAARLALIAVLVFTGANLMPVRPAVVHASAPAQDPTPDGGEDSSQDMQAPAVETAMPEELAPAPAQDAGGDLVAAEASDEDWPMYMHDASHSGRTPASTYTASPLYLQWAYSFGERVEVEAQPVTAAGVIYQGVMNGEMHAINALTGKAIWIVRPGGPIAHTAAVVDGRVIFGSLDGKIYALNASNGNLLWSFKTGAPVVSAPAVVEGTVYIGSNDFNLYALDAASGAERWHASTDGPVVSSPAVAGGRVYFGSEDLKARAVDASSGALVWQTQLYGQSMHNTHPIVSDSGNVVIFVTSKPGATSYVPAEDYPNASASANPVDTWNNYFRTHPKFRSLYYLNAQNGGDLWDAGSRRYSPLPIPYWGLLEPVLAPDGTAWFPAPSGATGRAFELDHDDRLFKVDLNSGETTMVAGGPGQPEFQTRPDEAGRHIFAGNDYLYTISEDLSVYHPGQNTVVLFGDGRVGYYEIGTHMAPMSPLPSLHLWRYGGVVAMGGVPGASVPVVANNMVYYSSYGWLYAAGQQNNGLDRARSFPKRSARAYELTYLKDEIPSTQQIREELWKRVAWIIERGVDNPPLVVKWEQPGGPMANYDTAFETYGFDYEIVRALSEAYPFLTNDQQAQLKAYLTEFVQKTLLNPRTYAYEMSCYFYGEQGIQVGDAICRDNPRLMVRWNGDNPNLVGERFYALWSYATATGDWDSVRSIWDSIILPRFKQFTDGYSSKLGYVNFAEWRVGRLDINAQILAAQAVRDMATTLGDTTTKARAATLLGRLLNGRVNLANFVPKLYDKGVRKKASIRLNSNGTIRYSDIMGSSSPYNRDLIPYSAAQRNRTTDPSQVNWWDGKKYRVDAGMGFMYFPVLSGYYPLSSELSARLRARLLSKTAYYVKSYEVNQPWWWMTDLAHHTTGSGEHLYTSPALSWSMFQVKARVQELGYDTLARQLPEPMSFNSKYDLYRLQNLATLLDVCRMNNCTR